jgi:hypothetical protein
MSSRIRRGREEGGGEGENNGPLFVQGLAVEVVSLQNTRGKHMTYNFTNAVLKTYGHPYPELRVDVLLIYKYMALI